MGEREIALSMAAYALRRLGRDTAVAQTTIEELRAGTSQVLDHPETPPHRGEAKQTGKP
jgi:hypothetical protein